MLSFKPPVQGVYRNYLLKNKNKIRECFEITLTIFWNLLFENLALSQCHPPLSAAMTLACLSCKGQGKTNLEFPDWIRQQADGAYSFSLLYLINDN